MKLIMAIFLMFLFLPATGLCQRTLNDADYNKYISFLKQMRQSDEKRVFRDYMERESTYKRKGAEKRGNKESDREVR